MNKYDRYRMELMRLSNNIQFYKHKIALCQASNARIFYEKLLAKEAKRFQELQIEYQRMDLRYQEVRTQSTEQNAIQNNETTQELEQEINQDLDQDTDLLNQQEQDDMEGIDQPDQAEPESEPEGIDQTNQEETEPESVEPEQPNQEGTVPIPDAQRVFTIEELSKFNGAGGQPAYVAVNGIVYDVSMEKRWGGGTHFSMIAGKNLTMNFNACHGGNIEVLRNLPKVGIVKQ